MSSSGHRHKGAFLTSEGDAYFRRNGAKHGARDHVDDLLSLACRGAKSVLEIGCSDGHRLSKLRESTDVTTLVGVDPSEQATSEGRRIHGLDLRVGTSDDTGLTDTFDVVIAGFCLYLTDVDLLPKMVWEVDSRLNDRGTLIIFDFDPPTPRTREYRHLSGVWSHKFDYSTLFTALPQYCLVAKHSMNFGGDPTWSPRGSDRTAVWILRKSLELEWLAEPDH